MTAFTPFALKPFDFSRKSFTQAENDYFRFYDLDFSTVNQQAIDHNFGYFILSHFTIATHYFSNKAFKKTAIINHGYMDHSGLYVHLIEALLAEEYNVLIYDHPGHGLSSGEQAGIGSFQDYQKVLSGLLDKMSAYMPKPWAMIGQSMGGAISADYILNHHSYGVEKLVLLAPLVVPAQWDSIKIQLQGLKHFLSGVPRKFRDSSLDKEFLRFLHEDDPLQTRFVKTSWVQALYDWQEHLAKSYPSDIDTLLIQGDDDDTIDWRYGLEVYKGKFIHLKIQMMPSAKHHLVCEAPVLRGHLFKAITEFLQA